MKLLLATVVLLSTICSCSTHKENQKPIDSYSGMSAEDSALLKEVLEAPSAQKVPLKNFTEADVAKFVISSVMSQSAKIMSVKNDEDFYVVSYTRNNDEQKFTYRVMIDDYNAVWGTMDGRWRDSPEDKLIVFTEVGRKLKVIQRLSDGSTIEKEFSK